MDNEQQDEADLCELIERYRGGFATSNIVEEISARWAKQKRACDGMHRTRKDIPMPEGVQEIHDRLMSQLRDD